MSKEEIYKDKAESPGKDYPFVAENRDPHSLTTKIALDTGWQYKGQNRDRVAALLRDKCLAMPIGIFKDH